MKTGTLWHSFWSCVVFGSSVHLMSSWLGYFSLLGMSVVSLNLGLPCFLYKAFDMIGPSFQVSEMHQFRHDFRFALSQTQDQHLSKQVLATPCSVTLTSSSPFSCPPPPLLSFTLSSFLCLSSLLFSSMRTATIVIASEGTFMFVTGATLSVARTMQRSFSRTGTCVIRQALALVLSMNDVRTCYFCKLNGGKVECLQTTSPPTPTCGFSKLTRRDAKD